MAMGDSVGDSAGGSAMDDILGGPDDILRGVEGDTKLTPEAIFVDEYVRSGNAFLACNKAGLSDPRYPMEVVARRTLDRPEIKAAIGVARELKRKGQLGGTMPGLYSREMLLEELQRTHEQALADRQYGSAIGAVKTQAQILGYMEQTVNVMHRVSPREMSLEDLRRLVAERAPVIEGEFRVSEDGEVTEGDGRLRLGIGR